MKTYQFSVLVERDEDDYYVATVPALKSCYTQAKTLEELHQRIEEVVKLRLAEEEPVHLKFVALEQLEIQV